MELILEGLREALQLLITGDALVFAALWRSLWISSLAVLLATLLALPCGALLARRSGPSTRLIVIILRAGMALPTVFIGLLGFALLSHKGPLGSFSLLYSPAAIILGEMILAFPIIAVLTHGAVKSLDPRVDETARSLGANSWQRFLTSLSEARLGILLAILTALGRCLTELGIAMMVGGNIKHSTRTLATSIAMETTQGNFGRGLAMGSLLLFLALLVTFLATVFLETDKT